jgi:SAM-dependent methyltransferase
MKPEQFNELFKKADEYLKSDNFKTAPDEIKQELVDNLKYLQTWAQQRENIQAQTEADAATLRDFGTGGALDQMKDDIPLWQRPFVGAAHAAGAIGRGAAQIGGLLPRIAGFGMRTAGTVGRDLSARFGSPTTTERMQEHVEYGERLGQTGRDIEAMAPESVFTGSDIDVAGVAGRGVEFATELAVALGAFGAVGAAGKAAAGKAGALAAKGGYIASGSIPRVSDHIEEKTGKFKPETALAVGGGQALITTAAFGYLMNSGMTPEQAKSAVVAAHQAGRLGEVMFVGKSALAQGLKSGAALGTASALNDVLKQIGIPEEDGYRFLDTAIAGAQGAGSAFIFGTVTGALGAASLVKQAESFLEQMKQEAALRGMALDKESISAITSALRNVKESEGLAGVMSALKKAESSSKQDYVKMNIRMFAQDVAERGNEFEKFAQTAAAQQTAIDIRKVRETVSPQKALTGETMKQLPIRYMPPDRTIPPQPSIELPASQEFQDRTLAEAIAIPGERQRLGGLVERLQTGFSGVEQARAEQREIDYNRAASIMQYAIDPSLDLDSESGRAALEEFEKYPEDIKNAVKEELKAELAKVKGRRRAAKKAATKRPAIKPVAEPAPAEEKQPMIVSDTDRAAELEKKITPWQGLLGSLENKTAAEMTRTERGLITSEVEKLQLRKERLADKDTPGAMREAGKIEQKLDILIPKMEEIKGVPAVTDKPVYKVESFQGGFRVLDPQGKQYSRHTSRQAADDKAVALNTGEVAPAKATPIKPGITVTPETADLMRNASNLKSSAESLLKKAQEDLGKDRQTNTPRRARTAAVAEAGAAEREAFAKTMLNIAEGMEKGEVNYLKNVRSRPDLQVFINQIRQAKIKYADKNDLSYGQTIGMDATEKVIKEGAVFQRPYPHGNWFNWAAGDLENLPDMKLAAKYLEKIGDRSRDRNISLNDDQIEKILQIKARLGKKKIKVPHQLERILDTITEYKKLVDAGIKSDSDLAEALIEYKGFAEGRKAADPLKAAERELVGRKFEGFDFFPTPPALAERIATELDIKPGMTVLEPSAGKGDLADAVKAIQSGAVVQTVEPLEDLQNILKLKGHDVVGADFESFETEERFDRIIMNPPFSKNRDIKHVRKAYDLLKPGGRLSAIMGNHFAFANDKDSVEFREWLDSVGGTSKSLGQAFMGKDVFRQTGVTSQLVNIEKSAETELGGFMDGIPFKTPEEAKSAYDKFVGSAETKPTPEKKPDPKANYFAIVQNGKVVSSGVYRDSDQAYLKVLANDFNGKLYIGQMGKPGEIPKDAVLTYEGKKQETFTEKKPEAEKAKVVDPKDITDKIQYGLEAEAYAPSGKKLKVKYLAVPENELITSDDPRFPDQYQPRKRKKLASVEQIESIAQNPIVDKLVTDFVNADVGTPVVAPVMIDGMIRFVVISGNGRTMAIRKGYKDKTMGEYQRAITTTDKRFNLPSVPSGRPVLVRVIQDKLDDKQLRRLASDLNRQDKLGMTAGEDAGSDAFAVVNNARLLQDDDLFSAANNRFISAFFTEVTSKNDEGRFFDSENNLSKEGAARLERAVFSAAYGDERLAEIFAEKENPNIKAILATYINVGAKIALINSMAKTNDLYDLDIGSAMAEAAELISGLRKSGTTIEGYFQQGQLWDDGVSALAKDILRQLDKYKRSGAKMTELFSTYNDSVFKLGSPKEKLLPGNKVPTIPTRAELFQAVVERMEDKYEKKTGDLFASPPPSSREVKAAPVAEGIPETKKTNYRIPKVGENHLADIAFGKEWKAKKAAEASVPAQATVKPTEKIEDFGEALHGAKKHLAAQYKVDIEKAQKLDPASVPLSKSWPAPNYQKMIEEGTDPVAVGVVRALRELLPSRPQKGYKLISYVRELEQARMLSLKLLESPEAQQALKDKISAAMSLSADKALTPSPSEESKRLSDAEALAMLYNEVGHDASLKNLRLRSAMFSMVDGVKLDSPKILWSIEPRGSGGFEMSYEDRRVMFGKTVKDVVDKFKAAYEKTKAAPSKAKKTEFHIFKKLIGENKGRFFIGKKIRSETVELKFFGTSTEAREYRANNYETLLAQYNGIRNIPFERREVNRPRIGKDRRGGKDITPETFAETFKLRGVQFGNWVEGTKRQEDLNEAFDALLDLAEIIGVPPAALSLNGELGLAFGARGIGGKRAAIAHYERDHVVINLTKTKGAGSLAHEWWHALDNYFGKKAGAEFITETGTIRGQIRQEMADAFNAVKQTIIRDTKMLKRSKSLDKLRSKDYWSETTEMTARAFESYLVDYMKNAGAENDYLVNIADHQVWEAARSLGLEDGDYPYLLPDELPAAKKAYGDLFKAVEQRATDKGVELYSVEYLAAKYGAKAAKAGYDWFKKGATKFADWARNMVKQFGKSVHKTLRSMFSDIQRVLADRRGAVGDIKKSIRKITKQTRLADEIKSVRPSEALKERFKASERDTRLAAKKAEKEFMPKLKEAESLFFKSENALAKTQCMEKGRKITSDLIKAVLPVEIRGALMDQTRNAKTMKRLGEISDKAIQYADKHYRRKEIDRFKTLLKKTERVHEVVGKDRQSLLKNLQIEEGRQALKTTRLFLRSFEESNPDMGVPWWLVQDLDDAIRLKKPESLSADEMKTINDGLQFLVDAQRIIKSAIVGGRYRDVKEIAESVENHLAGKKFDPGFMARTFRPKAELEETSQFGFLGLVSPASYMNEDGLTFAEMLGPDGKKVLYDETVKGDTVQNLMMQRGDQEFQDVIERAQLSPDSREFNDWRKEVVLRLKDRAGKTISLTRGEKLYLAGLAQFERARRSLSVSGVVLSRYRDMDVIDVTDNFLDELVSELTPQERVVLKGLTDHINKNILPAINDVHQRIKAFPLVPEWKMGDKYLPVSKDRAYKGKETRDNIMDDQEERLVTPSGFSFVKQTVDNTHPFRVTDITDVFKDHVTKTAVYVGHAETVRNIEMLRNMPGMEPKIIKSLGKERWNRLKLLVEGLSQAGNKPPTELSKWYMRGLRRIMPALLTPRSMLVQYTSLAYTSSHIPFKYIAAESGKFRNHRPIAVQELMNKDPDMWRRLSRYAGNILYSGNLESDKTSLFIKPFAHFDGVTMVIIHEAAKAYAKDTGKTEEWARELASRTIRETQNTGTVPDATLTQLTAAGGRDIVAYLGGVYSSQWQKLNNHLKRLYRDTKTGKSEKAKNIAFALIATALTSALADQLVSRSRGKKSSFAESIFRAANDTIFVNPAMRLTRTTPKDILEHWGAGMMVVDQIQDVEKRAKHLLSTVFGGKGAMAAMSSFIRAAATLGVFAGFPRTFVTWPLDVLENLAKPTEDERQKQKTKKLKPVW